MSQAHTRFALTRPWAARVILALLGGVMVYGILHSPPPPPDETAFEAGVGDVFLYRAIVDRVRGGEDYYRVVGEELPARGYAARPFFNWRLPTTAWLVAAFPSGEGAAWLLRGLSFLAILLFSIRLYSETLSLPRGVLGTVLISGALGMSMHEDAPYFHEIWAMVLLTISLAIHHRRYWIGSVAVGTVALFFRELALVYIGAMALAAWFTGRKREAFGWLFGCAVFLTGLAIHASIVSGHLSGDASGKSWLALGGWPFVLTTADWNFLLLVTPGWVTAIVAPLALVGAVAWRSHLGLQVSLILGGYFSAYMIVGNPDNDYWGILYAPFLALGLLYAVDGILDLWRVGRPAPEGAGD